MSLPVLKVIGHPELRDKETYEVLTGTMRFYADNLPGQKLYAALKIPDIGRGVVAVSSTNGGRVSAVTINNGGNGYHTSPKVVVSGGGGSGSILRAFAYNGKVHYIFVVKGGKGYTSLPQISFEGGGGSGASATATLSSSEPRIDTSKAEAVKGVKVILNYRDLGIDTTVTGAMAINHNGQAPLAAVVADNWHTALYAAKLIEVEYENPDDAFIPVIDPNYALQKNAVSANGNYPADRDCPNTPNWGAWATNRNGDTIDALINSNTSVTYENGFSSYYHCNMLEPHGSLAWWVGDYVYAWSGTQNSGTGKTATITGPGFNAGNGMQLANNAHYFTQGTGGGHADKNATPTIAWNIRLSMAVGGLPVQLVETRNHQVSLNSHMSGSDAKATIAGNTTDGIVAYRMESQSIGATAGGGTAGFLGLLQSYDIRALRLRQRSVNTNTGNRGGARGLGGFPGCMCYDSGIDLLAYKLGITPYELRMKNLRTSRSSATPFPGASIARYYGLELPSLLTKVRDMSGYANKFHLPEQGPARADGRKHGIALSCHVDNHGAVVAGRYISMVIAPKTGNTVPAVTVKMSGGRGPSGSPSAMAMIAAEALGFLYENVNVQTGAKDDTWSGGNQAGSQFTTGAGGAIYNAAMLARADILLNALSETAVATTETNRPSGRTIATATAVVTNGRVSGFTVTNGGAGYTGSPRITLSGGGGSGAVAGEAVVENGQVVSIGVTSGGSGYTSAPTVTIGWASVNDLDIVDSYVRFKHAPATIVTWSEAFLAKLKSGYVATGWGNPAGFSTAGSVATAAEVLVDTGTGEVDVIGIWNCVDTGRTINKRGTIKEMLSGCEYIVACTLYNGDIVCPNSGMVLSSYYTEGQVPTSLDMDTDTYKVFDWESGDYGVYGCHGIGGPVASNASAIHCAIYNAIGKFVDPEQGAMNPDRVLRALGKG